MRPPDRRGIALVYPDEHTLQLGAPLAELLGAQPGFRQRPEESPRRLLLDDRLPAAAQPRGARIQPGGRGRGTNQQRRPPPPTTAAPATAAAPGLRWIRPGRAAVPRCRGSHGRGGDGLGCSRGVSGDRSRRRTERGTSPPPPSPPPPPARGRPPPAPAGQRPAAAPWRRRGVAASRAALAPRRWGILSAPGRPLLGRAAGQHVCAGAESAAARGEQGGGDPAEAEAAHPEEPRLRAVLPLQARPAAPRPGVGEDAAAAAGGAPKGRDLPAAARARRLQGQVREAAQQRLPGARLGQQHRQPLLARVFHVSAQFTPSSYPCWGSIQNQACHF